MSGTGIAGDIDRSSIDMIESASPRGEDNIKGGGRGEDGEYKSCSLAEDTGPRGYLCCLCHFTRFVLSSTLSLSSIHHLHSPAGSQFPFSL